MEYVELNTGTKMPILGFGVYQIPKEQTKECVLNAIKVGYRLIDTAQSYFNESEVGEAIAECNVPRKELFITTKVWIDHYGYDKCRASIMKSLEKLKTDYLDLVLLHQPFGDYYEAYRALEDLYHEGKIKAIGVSNFYPDRLTDICLFGRKVIPAVNQVEVNPMNQQTEAQKNMQKYGVQTKSWTPFEEEKNGIFTNKKKKKIGEKYHKSVAQVILRWLIERKIVVVCKSTHLERMEENFNVFDFSLSKEDMDEIAKLDIKDSLFFNHQDPSIVEWFDKLIEERKKEE